MRERTPADFSREFAGYMADAAAEYMEAVQAYHEEQRSSGKNADPDGAAEHMSDCFRGLTNAIYEWRKREERAQRVSSATDVAAEDQT